MSLSNLFNDFFNNKEIKSLKHSDINDKILVIDGMNSFIIQYSANPILNANGIPVGGIIGFLNNILNCIRMFKPTRIVVVFDGIKGSTKRKQMFKLYKQNRSASSNGIHYKFLLNFTIELCRLNMSNQLRRVLLYLHCLPVTVISKDYVLADDVIAYIANKMTESKVIIASSDKDYLQLINLRVTVWSPVKKKMYNKQRVKLLFNILPLNFILYKSTIGDTSDNIDGVKGIAIKTFNKLFPLLSLLYKLLSSFLETIDNMESSRKACQTLKLSKLIINRNFELMQLQEPLLSSHTELLILLTLRDLPANITNHVLFIKLNVNDSVMSINLDLQTYLQNFRLLLAFSKKWNNLLSRKSK